MSFTVRRYRDADLLPLARAMRAVWQDDLWHTVTVGAARLQIREDLERGADMFVATDDGVVGFAWAYPLPERDAPFPDDDGFWRQVVEPAAYIAEFGVVPAARGDGIGTALLERLLDRLHDQYAAAVLRTHPDAEAAMHLYMKYGFERTGFDDVEEPDRVLLARRLQGSELEGAVEEEV